MKALARLAVRFDIFPKDLSSSLYKYINPFPRYKHVHHSNFMQEIPLFHFTPLFTLILLRPNHQFRLHQSIKVLLTQRLQLHS